MNERARGTVEILDDWGDSLGKSKRCTGKRTGFQIECSYVEVVLTNVTNHWSGRNILRFEQRHRSDEM